MFLERTFIDDGPHEVAEVRDIAHRDIGHLIGELLDANEAVRAGFLNEIVPPERLLDRALALAKACAEGGPNALAKTKEFLQQFSRQALSIEQAAEASAAPRLTEECQEGLRAFFAKKAAPTFCGPAAEGPPSVAIQRRPLLSKAMLSGQLSQPFSEVAR